MSKQVKPQETIFSIFSPPHVGNYKLEIFAASLPKTKGKLTLPIVATFMLEVRLKTQESVTGLTKLADINKHKLASIAEVFDGVSDTASTSGGIMYPDTHNKKRDSSARSIFSEFTLKGSAKNNQEQIPQIFSRKKRRKDEDPDSRRTSVFSISSFISRKLP